MTPDPV